MIAATKAVRFNRRVARAIQTVWPYRGIRAFDEFPLIVQRCIDRRVSDTLVDVGAGSDSSFLDSKPTRVSGLHLIGVDIDRQALDANRTLDERYVVDVAREPLPIPDCSAAILTSRSVLEHLTDVNQFVAESARVLAPGGFSIHICSCRNAPFAIVGRLLPHRFAQSLLYTLHPEVTDTQGYKTYYNRCTPSELATIFADRGFELIDLRVSFRSSQYFTSLGPLFLLARVYEQTIGNLHLTALASYVTVVARRPTGVLERTR